MLNCISISLFSNIFVSIAHILLFLSFTAITFCAKNEKTAENGTKKVLKTRKKLFSWISAEQPLLPNEVHKPINEAVAEGLILDPKNVKYVKNIDRKQNPLEQRLEIDLNHISGEKEEEAPLFSTGRVRIRESKCKLYETCDVKTADEADENSLKTCRA